MRFRAVEQARFGILEIREPVALAPGLNICVAPNQAGKSTLLTLIEWVLYGVPPKGRKRNHEEVERWRSWGTSAEPQVSILLEPQLPAWPEQVRVAVSFQEFAPHLLDAGSQEPLAGTKFISVDKNGSWDLGERLTGLKSQAFGASLLARQEEMDNLLADAGLRRLLTADLSGLVEDPERATLDEALRQLEDPKFLMAGLAEGEVQVGTLLRRASEHWKMAQGSMENQQERFARLEGMLADRESAEHEMRELVERLGALELEAERLELAVAHWRFAQLRRLEGQLAEWRQRLADAPWLAEFPRELQRAIDTWTADHRNLREQLQAAAGQVREAEALKLRAPYVELVHPEQEQEIVRLQERGRGVAESIKEQEARLARTSQQLQRIDKQLERLDKLKDQVEHAGELRELQSALVASRQDWEAADGLVREYGEATDPEARQRLEELESAIGPHRAYLPQVLKHLELRESSAARRAAFEARQAELEAQVRRGAGRAWLGAAAILGLVGVLVAAVGALAFEPAWVGVLVGLVFLLAGAGSLALAVRRGRATAHARAQLHGEVLPGLKELADAEAGQAQQARQLCLEHELAADVWEHLVGSLPEYQRLRIALDNYYQALRDREGAAERGQAAWQRLRALCADAPEQTDDKWLAGRLRTLLEVRELETSRLDEHSKVRDAETGLEHSRRDQAELMGKLAHYLDPLGLGEQLERDADGAVRRYQGMVREAQRYGELQQAAQRHERLTAREQELRAELARLLAPLGLAQLAGEDAEAALRAFEQCQAEAERYGALQGQYADVEEEAGRLRLTSEEYEQRWRSLSAEQQAQLAALVSDDESCDKLLRSQRAVADNLKSNQLQLERARERVGRFRVQAAKDEDVLDTLAAAREQEQAARASLAAARRWHRALELLSRELSVLERELAGNLAPQLTAELAAVLERAPVARVKRVGLSSQLELLLDVADAPPGLAGAELMERLSLGARRQLALALRVAVGRALGEARAVPLLLDEPLAELDDEHALASLRYLGTLAAEQQVILMTCHARHYDWLRRESGVAAHVVSLP